MGLWELEVYIFFLDFIGLKWGGVRKSFWGGICLVRFRMKSIIYVDFGYWAFRYMYRYEFS